MLEINENFTATADSSIANAAEKINLNKSRCLFITKEQKLVASFSEGDIIRAFLHGGNFHSRIKDFANYSPKFLITRDLALARNLMCKYGILVVPIVDTNMTLLNVVTLNDILYD